MTPESPLFVVGADRSGTTLLRVILNRHPELAIPPESHFIPKLWEQRGRYGSEDSVERIEGFLLDLASDIRFSKWELPIDAVRAELDGRRDVPFAEALGAPFVAYARTRGRTRWGDKTPGYAEHIDLLRRLWPSARFVHMIRDGRDVALSVLDLQRGMHRHAATVARFWAQRIRDARSAGARLGPDYYHELRYEDLLAEPERAIAGLCAFTRLDFDPAMLDHDARAIEDVPAAERRRHTRVALPPTKGLRDWRTQMPPREVAEFEAVAGRELAVLGYERTTPVTTWSTSMRSRARFTVFAASSIPRRVRVVRMQSRRRRDLRRGFDGAR